MRATKATGTATTATVAITLRTGRRVLASAVTRSPSWRADDERAVEGVQAVGQELARRDLAHARDPQVGQAHVQVDPHRLGWVHEGQVDPMGGAPPHGDRPGEGRPSKDLAGAEGKALAVGLLRQPQPGLLDPLTLADGGDRLAEIGAIALAIGRLEAVARAGQRAGAAGDGLLHADAHQPAHP